jgi:hypothetical protein
MFCITKTEVSMMREGDHRRLYRDPDFDAPDSEDEFRDTLAGIFDRNGWYVETELKSNTSDYRADIIVQKSGYGWFGIETKYFTGEMSGRKLSDAHEQIIGKYQGEKFLNHQVDLWCFAGFYESLRERSLNTDRPYETEPAWKSNTVHSEPWQFFIREFFCNHGVGYIPINGYYLRMDFSYSDNQQKVPITDNSRHNPDIELIQSEVNKKISSLAYSDAE